MSDVYLLNANVIHIYFIAVAFQYASFTDS